MSRFLIVTHKTTFLAVVTLNSRGVQLTIKCELHMNEDPHTRLR